MDDLVLVHVVQRVRELRHPARRLRLAEALLPLEPLVKLTARSKLQHQVDALLVVEVAVHPQHARVVQARLDLDFLAQLGDNAPAVDVLLEDDLQRDHHPAGFLTRHIHVPKLATAERLPHIKVCQSPRGRRSRRCLAGCGRWGAAAGGGWRGRRLGDR